MIEILISIETEERASVRLEGHAGAEKVNGFDVVCAYASGAVDALAFALREHIDEEKEFCFESGLFSAEVNTAKGVEILRAFADFSIELGLTKPEFVKTVQRDFFYAGTRKCYKEYRTML